MGEGRIESALVDEGRVLEIVLAAPPGNVLTIALLEALGETLLRAREQRHLRAVRLSAKGAHFSYGASVHEHAPEHVEALLAAMRKAVHALVELGAFTTACVRGRCLGGGLELALACDRIVCSPEAELGQPEIRLAVFAPLASVLLPLRVGEARAVQLLASGVALAAREALTEGLVDAVAEAPEEEAAAWERSRLFNKSAEALRHALWAARVVRRRALETLLPAIERRYLEALMASRDANEGIRAFIEKRTPVYEDR